MNKLIEAMVRHDTPSPKADVNFPAFADALRQIRDRFIEERTKGFLHPVTNEQVAPVSPEEAERRWQAVEPRFREVLLNSMMNKPEDPANKRLGLRRAGLYPKSSDYRDTSTEPWGPGFESPEMNPQDYEQGWAHGKLSRGERGRLEDPALRRGESRANHIVKKLIG